MKKVVFALLAITFIAVSCSKESKLNKKLDSTGMYLPLMV